MVEETAQVPEVVLDTKSIPDSQLISDDVKEYEPSLEDQFIILDNGNYQRLIFQNQELRDREEEHIEDFRSFLQAKKLQLPEGYDDQQREVLRFLQGCNWDYQMTYDEINEHKQWKNTIREINTAPFGHYLEIGILYGLKRDKAERPILVVDCRKMIDTKISLELLCSMSQFYLQFVIDRCMSPGHVENWLTIFDMSGVGASEVPKDKLKGLVNAMQKNFRGRLYKFYSIEVTYVVKVLWQTAHRFVDDFTNRKLLIYGDDYREHLHKDVDPENLEEKYGGKLPNKTDNYWPPQFN